MTVFISDLKERVSWLKLACNFQVLRLFGGGWEQQVDLDIKVEVVLGIWDL